MLDAGWRKKTAWHGRPHARQRVRMSTKRKSLLEVRAVEYDPILGRKNYVWIKELDKLKTWIIVFNKFEESLFTLYLTLVKLGSLLFLVQWLNFNRYSTWWINLISRNRLQERKCNLSIASLVTTSSKITGHVYDNGCICSPSYHAITCRITTGPSRSCDS